MWNPFASKRAAPAAVASDTKIPLGWFDDNPVFRCFILRLMLRFDDVLDPEKLKTSLETLISREGWCRLGARLRLNDNNKLEYHVPASFDEKRPAILYFNVKHDMNISEHKLASQQPRPSTEPAVVGNADELAPLYDAPGFPTSIDDYIYSDIPQLGLYIISFNDATLVTLSWAHTLFDAMGRKALFDAWSMVLSGREDEVPPFLGYDHDPLAEFGSLGAADSYKLANRALSPWQGIIFGLRYAFDLVYYNQEDTRIVCVPASKIKALKQQVMEKITAESADSFVSEGDVLCAYWSRYALSHLDPNSSRTVSLMNAFGLRATLSKDVLPGPGSYLGNALISVYAFFSVKEIYETPLYRVALKIRQAMIELGAKEQLEAGSAANRKSLQATGFTPVYGDATMHLLIYTNWTKAKFFETDFSAAVVKQGLDSANRSSQVGRPSYIQPHSYIKTYSARNTFAILGKDAQGNYWMSGGMRKGLWASLEKDLVAAKYDS